VKTSSGITAMRRSGIREIMDLAAGREGILHLEVGEPDFATPDHIVRAGAEAAAQGWTKYTANKGLPDLREALVAKLAARNGIHVDPDRVVVTVGAVNALMESLMAIVDPGDAILLPDPGWPNYEMMAASLHARVVRYPLLPGEGFAPDLDALEHLARTTDGARVLITNSPGNPTGAVFDAATVERLVAIARNADLWLLSDECYEDIVFDDAVHVSPAAFDDDGRVLSVFSFSKSYAMTGWRVGYVALTRELADLVAKAQEAVASCACSVSQKAALAAVTGDRGPVELMRSAYEARRDVASELLGGAGLLVSEPRGAFYAMADVAGTGLDSYAFARQLLLDEGVAVAPGDTFGPGGASMVRLSLSTASADVEEGVRRLVRQVGKLRGGDGRAS
jgi:aspartate/methionine/tyrosine aminotransferase